MQRLNFIAIAEGYETRLRMGALIESENEGAIESRGVVGAGCVAKMVIETQEPRTAAQKRLEKILEGEENGLFVQKRDCGAPADGGDAKYAHEIGSARFRSRKDRLAGQSTKIFAFGVGHVSRQESVGR